MAISDRDQLRQWAVRGAEQRLLEIASEAAAIYRTFPELRDRQNGAGQTVEPSGGKTTAAAPKRGRHMRSAAARQAARERMLKYWAERRESEGTEPTATASTEKTVRRRTARARKRGRRKMSAAARKRIRGAEGTVGKA
jgi:hypothetical protein